MATDESIGFNAEGQKLYKLDGFDHPQVLGYGFRIVRGGANGGYRLQKQYTGKPRGEMTQIVWADIPVVDEAGKLLGYEFGG